MATIFSEKQQELFEIGRERGLDISIYAKEEFSYDQMYEVMCALIELNNPDLVRKYATTEYTAKQMNEIYYGCIEGLDVSSFDKPNIPAKKMEELRLRQEVVEGLICNPHFCTACDDKTHCERRLV